MPDVRRASRSAHCPSLTLARLRRRPRARRCGRIVAAAAARADLTSPTRSSSSLGCIGAAASTGPADRRRRRMRPTRSRGRTSRAKRVSLRSHGASRRGSFALELAASGTASSHDLDRPAALAHGIASRRFVAVHSATPASRTSLHGAVLPGQRSPRTPARRSGSHSAVAHASAIARGHARTRPAAVGAA